MSTVRQAIQRGMDPGLLRGRTFLGVRNDQKLQEVEHTAAAVGATEGRDRNSLSAERSIGTPLAAVASATEGRDTNSLPNPRTAIPTPVMTEAEVRAAATSLNKGQRIAVRWRHVSCATSMGDDEGWATWVGVVGKWSTAVSTALLALKTHWTETITQTTLGSPGPPPRLTRFSPIMI